MQCIVWNGTNENENKKKKKIYQKHTFYARIYTQYTQTH